MLNSLAAANSLGVFVVSDILIFEFNRVIYNALIFYLYLIILIISARLKTNDINTFFEYISNEQETRSLIYDALD